MHRVKVGLRARLARGRRLVWLAVRRCWNAVHDAIMASIGLACITTGVFQWSVIWGWVAAGLSVLALEVKREADKR